ncbi:hypothetical protein LDENG_00163360, partial [Lucifuga dentata]
MNELHRINDSLRHELGLIRKEPGGEAAEDESNTAAPSKSEERQRLTDRLQQPGSSTDQSSADRLQQPG